MGSLYETMFGSKAGAYLRGEHLKEAPLGKAPTLIANITLGCKGLPGTNAQAYFAHIRGNKVLQI